MGYEEKIVAEKIINLLKESEAFEPDLDYFKHIHKVLFEDLYDFAGQFRTVDIVKTDSNFPFCFALFLPSESERIFGDLKAKNYLKNLKKPRFYSRNRRLFDRAQCPAPFSRRKRPHKQNVSDDYRLFGGLFVRL